jgi:hypothetical protein
LSWRKIILVASAITLLSYCGAAYIGKRNIADEMIALAVENDGIVDLLFLGERVCLIPEGAGARLSAEMLFPEKEKVLHGSNESSGFWYVAAISHESSSKVEIFGITRSEIFWYASRGPLHSHIHCANVLKLQLSNGVWSYTYLEGVR